MNITAQQLFECLSSVSHSAQMVICDPEIAEILKAVAYVEFDAELNIHKVCTHEYRKWYLENERKHDEYIKELEIRAAIAERKSQPINPAKAKILEQIQTLRAAGNSAGADALEVIMKDL